MKFYEIYTHGVGSACQGEEYHHEVMHLAPEGTGRKTVCGQIIKGRDWWKELFFTVRLFMAAEPHRYALQGESYVCLRCQRIAKNDNG